MNRSWFKTLFGGAAAVLLVVGCSETSTQPPETTTPTVPTPPTVTTNSVSGITSTTERAPIPAAVEALFGNDQEGQVGHDPPDHR